MNRYRNWKVVFDGALAFVLILFFLPLLAVLFIVATADTGSHGIFFQKRIGQFGKAFTIYKFKTIHDRKRASSRVGLVLRKYKLDELPQLFNILKGDMSFVGPRPDVKGYYDALKGTERKVLDLKPGLTSEASIKYHDEEALLQMQENPLRYNDEVIFPDKIRMNLHYLENMSLANDLRILMKTILKLIIK